MKKLAFINGTVVTHERSFFGVVLVKDGKIERVVGPSTSSGSAKGDFLGEDFEGYEVVDALGLHILPGAIDVHVHFRVPGGEMKEDWEHGSKAALAGGVTTVLDMPNTNPPSISAQLLEEKRAMVRDKAMVNYGFYAGAMLDEKGKDNVEEVAGMKGIAGVKIYMGSSTAAAAGPLAGNLLVDDLAALERFMTETDHLLVFHAENEACIQRHGGVRDPECAYEAVKDVLHLAKKHGRRVHLAHVSTARELEAVRKFDEPYVSVEVTPHHLFLTLKDYEQYGSLLKVNPPVRNEADQVALWEGLKDGTVDMVATDHAPHLLAEKEQSYGKAPSGVPGVQTMLPLLLNAVNEGRLSLEKVVELCSYNPAQKFGVKGKGVLEEGADADLVLVDMGLVEKVCHHFLWSKCGWSPFHGWVLQGWPVKTFVGGALRYTWRDTFFEGRGREVIFS